MSDILCCIRRIRLHSNAISSDDDDLFHEHDKVFFFTKFTFAHTCKIKRACACVCASCVSSISNGNNVCAYCIALATTTPPMTKQRRRANQLHSFHSARLFAWKFQTDNDIPYLLNRVQHKYTRFMLVLVYIFVFLSIALLTTVLHVYASRHSIGRHKSITPALRPYSATCRSAKNPAKHCSVKSCNGS